MAKKRGRPARGAGTQTTNPLQVVPNGHCTSDKSINENAVMDVNKIPENADSGAESLQSITEATTECPPGANVEVSSSVMDSDRVVQDFRGFDAESQKVAQDVAGDFEGVSLEGLLGSSIPVRCEVCRENFSKQSLKDHQAATGHYKCVIPDCGLVFDVDKDLAHHLTNDHEDWTIYQVSDLELAELFPPTTDILNELELDSSMSPFEESPSQESPSQESPSQESPSQESPSQESLSFKSPSTMTLPDKSPSPMMRTIPVIESLSTEVAATSQLFIPQQQQVIDRPNSGSLLPVVKPPGTASALTCSLVQVPAPSSLFVLKQSRPDTTQILPKASPQKKQSLLTSVHQQIVNAPISDTGRPSEPAQGLGSPVRKPSETAGKPHVVVMNGSNRHVVQAQQLPSNTTISPLQTVQQRSPMQFRMRSPGVGVPSLRGTAPTILCTKRKADVLLPAGRGCPQPAKQRVVDSRLNLPAHQPVQRTQTALANPVTNLNLNSAVTITSTKTNNNHPQASATTPGRLVSPRRPQQSLFDRLNTPTVDLTEDMTNETPVNADRTTSVQTSPLQQGRGRGRPRKEPNICPVCDMGFALSAELQRHMMTHLVRNSGKLNFKCNVCNAQYESKAGLTMHTRTYHSVSAKGEGSGETSGGTRPPPALAPSPNWVIPIVDSRQLTTTSGLSSLGIQHCISLSSLMQPANGLHTPVPIRLINAAPKTAEGNRAGNSAASTNSRLSL